MATKTAFKQQCPSCEAMVPIRDSGLIGKKIDCPKCKYRFVVEEPEGEEDDLDEKPGKGKKGGAAVTAKRPVNGKATVKGKGGLQQRPDEEDDEEDEETEFPEMDDQFEDPEEEDSFMYDEDEYD